MGRIMHFCINFKYDKNYDDVNPQGKLNLTIATTRDEPVAVDKSKYQTNLHVSNKILMLSRIYLYDNTLNNLLQA